MKSKIKRILSTLMAAAMVFGLLAVMPLTAGAGGDVEPMLAAGEGHSLALHSDGTVWAWGNNADGQLGDGTTTGRRTPVQVSNLSDVVFVAAGSNFSVALKREGTVWVWGENKNGQLGDGSTASCSVPKQVSGLSGVVAIAAGSSHVLALLGDTVWGWGRNTDGQLGIGTITVGSPTVPIPGMSGVEAIAAGYSHSMALKNDDTVWAWGHNYYGQLGLGDSSSTPRSSPTQIPGLSGAATIIAAGYYSMALKRDGTLLAWGDNGRGQLCDGTTTDRSAPSPTTSLGVVTAVSAAYSHAVALKSDSTVLAWGHNIFGQLGDGSNTSHSTSAPVTGLNGVVAIATGAAHSMALKSDGTVWAWGHNIDGRLGDSTVTNRALPVQVVGPDGVGYLNLNGPPPVTLPAVCRIGSTDYTNLGAALNQVATNQTITLLDDIDYNAGITIDQKIVTFALNGFKLNVVNTGGAGVVVGYGELRLSGTGEFNVTGTNYGVDSHPNSKTTVTSARATDPTGVGVGARGEVTVLGNVTATGASATGAIAVVGGNITINGSITVPASATYIRVDNVNKVKDDGVRKDGYLEYAGDSSIVRVRDTAKTVTVGAQSGSIRPGTAGTVTFSVTTANIDNGKTGTVTWFTTAAGTTAGTAPAGITAAVSNVASNAATVTVTATTAAVAGTYYFKVTIDGVTSAVVTLTVAAKTVTVGAQSRALSPGTAGTTTFPVTTVGIDNGKTGAVSWFTNAAGTTAGTAPTGVTAAVSNVAANAATVTVTATTAAVAGSYYFKVTIDGVTSAVVTLRVGAGSGLSDGMKKFVKILTYTRGQFIDVNETAWYGYDQQKVIALAYEYGLMQGFDDTHFVPMGDVTIAQALAIACRVHSIYTTGGGGFTQGVPWYQVYVDYATANGIINANDFNNYDRSATRAEMAYIFSRSLPAEEFAAINTVNSLPDVSNGTPYYSSILMLYKAGIVMGDTTGAFFPANPINRAEASAIISRLILPDTRTSGSTYG